MSSQISYYCGSPGATGNMGPPGATGATGATGGTGATGNNGSITTFGNFRPMGMTNYNGVPQHIDQYFNVWWYVGNNWNKIANIIGPSGDKGNTGLTGQTGNKGATGQTGDKGPKGYCRVGNNLNMIRIMNEGTNSVMPIILYPYLYTKASNYTHTIKFSYKLTYRNDSSNPQYYSIILYNNDGILTKFTVNVHANTFGIDSNLDMLAGLNSIYYYVAWVVSDVNLSLTLDNICLRTLS